MTSMSFLVNFVDAVVSYFTTPADYILVDLTNDYLIWTKGDATVKDLMTHEPTASELNAAAEVISDSVDVMMTLCLLMDYSHNIGGTFYTHKVIGMGENKQYVYCFSFDGATATEPQLEAWDTSGHTTTDKHVLGAGTPASSMVKGKCTTITAPGASWAGTPIAGASNVILLNATDGALSDPGSGLTNDLYCNLKIVLPTDYSTPSVETFVFTVRYTYA